MPNSGIRRIAWATGAIAAAFLAWQTYLYFFSTSTSPFAGPASEDPPVFVDRTADFGISVSHRQGDEKLTGLDEALGSGACAFDYDNDGWVDLFIVNGAGDTRFYGRRHWWQEARGHRLLRNMNGKEFSDVTDTAGVGAVSQGMGCVTADFDNDGHTDLLVTNIGPNLLFRNQGDGSFRDVTPESGLSSPGWHTAAAVADADGDGKLDLYVGGFIDFEKGARTYEPGSQFRQDLPPFFNSALYPALPNQLYRNLGDMKFEDVTAAAGVVEQDGRTLAAVWTDLNDDRRPDLVVLNATGTGATTGFINRGDWQFDPLGLQARIESGLSFRGIAIGDLDHDGRAELVMSSAAGHQTVLLVRQEAAADPEPGFADQARAWQLAREQYAALSPWGPGIADLNNDGWPDLVVVNGQLLPDPDAPHVTVGQPKQLWLNSGERQLREYSPGPLSPLRDRQSARGMVLADFNNDGSMDLYVAHNNDLGQLLINERPSQGQWLGIRLEDPETAPEGVGAQVTVTTEQGAQTQWVTKGAGFLSDRDVRVHFGLGTASRADILVLWPDGSRSRNRDVPLNRYLTVSRRDGLEEAPEPDGERRAGVSGDPEADDVEVRREYYAGLAAVADTEGIDGILRKSLDDPDQAVRLAVVKGLVEHPSAPALRLLLRFLEDESDAVAASAVAGVCGFEEEDTTRFLLRAFSHPAAAVRQQAADCFTRYNRDFQDQKAVIQRKDLAAPYLTGLLDDPDKNVRISAIRALGASEEFRGVQPLVEMLADNDAGLRSEAIRALGLIRDRSALPALLKLLVRPDLDPGNYAQLFIALKRLDYGELDGTLRDFAAGRGSFGGLPRAQRLGAFLELLDSPEGVVLPGNNIQSLAGVAFAGSAGATDAVLYASICRKSGTASTAASLAPLTKNANPQVRAAAFLAQLRLDPPGRASLVTRALADPDPAVRKSILEQVAADNVVLADTLFLGALQNPPTALAAANALREIRTEGVARVLLTWLQDTRALSELRIAALEALTRARYRLSLPDSLYRSASEGLRISMLRYEARQLPAILVARTPPPFLKRYLETNTPALQEAVFDFLLTREELWAKQEVLELLQGAGPPELRRHVLERLPETYFRDGSALLKIAQTTADPLRLDALQRLRGVQDAASIAALTALARNDGEDRNVRILAAVALPPDNRKEVLPGLLGQ